MVQKISFRQIFLEQLNPHCDLDLENSNHDDQCTTIPNWVDKDSETSRDMKETVIFEDFSPHCDLDLEDRS